MNSKSIENEKEYNDALQKIDKLMDAVSNTKEFEELNQLIALVEKYKEKHYKIDTEAVEEYNKMVEKEGIFLEKSRMF